MTRQSAVSQSRRHRLLTGFEGFYVNGVLRKNPTIDIVKALASQVDDVAILPVEFVRTYTEFERILNESAPTSWLGLGLAANRATIEIECIALNMQSSEGPDNAGTVRTNQAILANSPLAYQTALPVSELLHEITSQGFTAKASFHAGTFLCNQVYYQALHRVAQEHTTLRSALFVHIPGPEHQAVSDSIDVVRTILDWHSRYTG